MKTSPALRRWQIAKGNAERTRANYDRLGVGPNPTLARHYLVEADLWAARQADAYAALTPEDKAVADRIAKETP